MAFTLREDQADLKQRVRASYAKGHRSVLAVAPTGWGKTVFFSDLAKDTANNGYEVLVMAHRKELLTQCGGKMNENGVDFGYISPLFTPNYRYKIQVGSIQTIVGRMKKISWRPKLIIIDEAHRSMAKTYETILEHFKDARVLGVTATPIRADGKPLKDRFQDMIVGPSIADVIAMGNLVQPITYAPKVQIDLTKIHTTMGDYDKKELEIAMDKPKLVGDAIEHYRRLCPGVPAVVFCVSVATSQHVAEQFRAAGYIFKHIDGSMSDGERTAILSDLSAGKIQGITSVDLVSEGFDCPALACAIMLRPTKSLGLYLQMAGRVLRKMKGKTQAFILDHAGLTLKHGLVTREHEWTLDVEEKIVRKKGDIDKVEAVKVKQCKNCYMMHEPAPKCPSCGFIYIIEGRNIETEEGELMLVDAGYEIELKNWLQKAMAGAKSLQDFVNIEKKMNYKYGWARRQYGFKNGKELKLN